MLRKYYIVAMGLGLFLFLTGCSKTRITTLEDQVTRMQAQNAALQAEVESLRTGLDKAQNENRELKEAGKTKDETIASQEETLNDLQMQNLELKANLEGSPMKKSRTVQPVSLSGDFELNYDEARKLFEQRWYTQAASLFNNLVKMDRSHKLADNAQYWLGECYYAQKQYENALAEFEKVFAFHDSNKADVAQLKIGLCWLQMGKYVEAREQLIRLLSAYPDSEYVPRARDILDQIP